MTLKTAEELHLLTKSMLLAAGAGDEHAEIVAEHLVASELAGVETHGMRPIWLYFKNIREGQLLPAAEPEILEETATSALISGGWTFGHVAARYGMDVAIEKAATSNIAIVSLVQLHHIGRVGYYGEMAADAGMVGIIVGSGYCTPGHRAAPYGGREGLMDTNPISIGIPNPTEPDQRTMLLDYATTYRAQGALFLANMRGEEVSPEFVIDRDGNPSTNADILAQGGHLLPFGKHKGYALMMAAEYMARIVSGSDEFVDPDRGSDMFRHQGVTMIVFKADLFRPMERYAESAYQMSQRARAVAPAPGFDEVLVPGDPEANARARRQDEGIPIADDIWAMICENAEALGVDTGA
jgi:LDH2 family malate/lactate/ureidoglycolate dehydrogenase